MKWRLQYCASAQSAAGRHTPMHNIGAVMAVMADALLKGTPLSPPPSPHLLPLLGPFENLHNHWEEIQMYEPNHQVKSH